MKRLLLVAWTALALSPLAFASPAQDLFDQAGFYLSFNYNGFSKVDPEALVDKYQRELDRACGAKAEGCGYGTAETVIKSMLAELGDEHSYYVEPQDAQDFTAGVGGMGDDQVVTMGVVPALFSDGNGVAIRVIELLEDSAAEQAGLQRLDRINAINGQRFPTSRDGALRFFQSADQSGDSLRLSVDRAGRTFELTVRPRRTAVALLPFMNVVNGIARIRVLDFTGFNEVAPKLHQLVKKAQSLNVRGIVVDLRDNPGGTATECLAGVSAFMPDVSRIRDTRRERFTDTYKDGRVFFTNAQGVETTYYTIPNPAKWTGKLTVLVNQESASCAEYFASDVQFYKRGTVIGERSYGLGNTGTRPFDLINGGLMTVTLIKSLFPNGTPYPERVVPDTFVRDNFQDQVVRGTDAMFERAVQEIGN
jgi:carboxyl-terminal processing protease